MRATRSDSYYGAFVLKEDDLKKLVEDFQALIGPVSFEIECADSVTRYPDSLRDLLAFDNPPRKAIRKLKIITHTDEPPNTARLRLSADREHNIQIALDASEEVATQLNDRIEDRIDSMRPWYSPLRRGSIGLTSILLWFGALIVGNQKGWLVGKQQLLSDPTKHQSDKALYVLAGMTLGIGLVAGQLRQKYFPAGVFAIGQGASEHGRNEVIRGIIITFIVGLATGAVFMVRALP